MACCVGFDMAKQAIEDVVKTYHPKDYKLFSISRNAGDGIEYSMRLGIVVLPDVDKNTQMFEALIKLQGRSDLCIKVMSSQIDKRDATMVDLFVVEIRIQAV